MPRGWGFDSLFCPEGRVFVHNDYPGGRVLPPWSRASGAEMVLHEINSCIMLSRIVTCCKNVQILIRSPL